MTKERIVEVLIEELPRAGQDLLRLAKEKSPWLRWLAFDVYPPALPEQPEDHTLSELKEVLGVQRRTYTYNLEQTALESAPLDLSGDTQSIRKQLKVMNPMLLEGVALWESLVRGSYKKLATKVIAKDGLPHSTSEHFPKVEPTSTLTPSLVNFYRGVLARDGVTETDLSVFLSVETAGYIYSQTKTQTISFLGQTLDWGSPPRYHFVDEGVWRQADQFFHELMDNGNLQYKVHPDYESAPYEDTVIWHPEVMTCLIPGFNPENPSLGKWEWKWLSETSGCFRAVFQAAFRPIHPEWGVVIRHKRP